MVAVLYLKLNDIMNTYISSFSISSCSNIFVFGCLGKMNIKNSKRFQKILLSINTWILYVLSFSNNDENALFTVKGLCELGQEKVLIQCTQSNIYKLNMGTNKGTFIFSYFDLPLYDLFYVYVFIFPYLKCA